MGVASNLAAYFLFRQQVFQRFEELADSLTLAFFFYLSSSFFKANFKGKTVYRG